MKKFIVAIAISAMLMTAPAFAADWNFYGSARVTTWWDDKDNADTTNLNAGLQGNARIGANVKVSDELTGRFEYGASGGTANIRLLYGEWNFGAGSLLIGQAYEPIWHSISNQAWNGDYGLGGFGENYAGRTGQIQLKFAGFQLAFVAPDIQYYDGTVGVVALADGDEVSIPAIQAKYRYIQDNWDVGISGGYSTFDVTKGGTEYSVDSFMIAGVARMTFGAAGLRGQIWGGENVGNIATQEAGPGAIDKGYAIYTAAGVMEDTDAVGYAIVADYKVNDMLGLEVGYGFVTLETNGMDDNEVESYYLSAPITLAPGVFVVPEVGVVDYKEAQEDNTYFGAKWQINF